MKHLNVDKPIEYPFEDEIFSAFHEYRTYEHLLDFEDMPDWYS